MYSVIYASSAWDEVAVVVISWPIAISWLTQKSYHYHSDAVPIAEYGGGSGKIHSFSCVGDETHLGNCSGDMDITYCGHSKDAGAMCSDFG